ncbi:MAG: PrsW family intramembrane metalloprotease [Geodermatophilaceae bacterium]
MPSRSQPDRRARTVLVIAVALSGLYALTTLVDYLRPRIGEDDPALGILLSGSPVAPVVTLGVVVSSWVAAAALGLVAVAVQPDPRVGGLGQGSRWTYLIAAVLMAPWLIISIGVLLSNPLGTLACLPTTAFGYFLVTRMQRFRRLPAWLTLSAFAWGALIAIGFSAAMNITFLSYVLPYLAGAGAGLDGLLDVALKVPVLGSLHAGIFEELAKGLGVAILYVLFRRHIDNVVSGIVLGACVGLGFNFNESIQYMSVNDPGAGVYAFWGRQTLGLMAAHLAFTAVVGAGFGIAAQLREPRQRRLVIGAGFVIAMSAHFASNVVLSYYGKILKARWDIGDTVDTLVMLPLAILLLQGPFVAMYVLLIRRGAREESSALTLELAREARSPYGSVTVPELYVLLNPRKRLRAKVHAWRSGGGVVAYRLLDRLYQAQYTVGTQRWHRSRDELDPFAPPDDVLRAKAMHIKAELAASWQARQWAPPLAPGAQGAPPR